MKKIFSLAVALFASVAMFAQVSIVPKVGVNIANVSEGNADSRIALVAGVEANYQMSDAIALTAGALYSGQGVKDGALNYINIPVLANYYLMPGLAVKAGVQPAFLISSDADSKALNSFDLSVPVGVSYEISNFVIDARYNIGVTNFMKEIEGVKIDSKNSVIQITLGYKL